MSELLSGTSQLEILTSRRYDEHPWPCSYGSPPPPPPPPPKSQWSTPCYNRRWTPHVSWAWSFWWLPALYLSMLTHGYSQTERGFWLAPKSAGKNIQRESGDTKARGTSDSKMAPKRNMTSWGSQLPHSSPLRSFIAFCTENFPLATLYYPSASYDPMHRLTELSCELFETENFMTSGHQLSEPGNHHRGAWLKFSCSFQLAKLVIAVDGWKWSWGSDWRIQKTGQSIDRIFWWFFAPTGSFNVGFWVHFTSRFKLQNRRGAERRLTEWFFYFSRFETF